MHLAVKNKPFEIPFVDLKAQYLSIKDEIDAAIRDVLETSAFIGGNRVAAFEGAFAEFSGVRYCVGVANGTDALFVALKTLGIGPGDEVITVANSFVATTEAITMAGARVVFADIDPRTYNIDPGKIEEKITEKTKAIIPVHLYGQPADMESIQKIARRHSLKIIGDAAQAHGSLYRGLPVSQLADITCFSFYPGKNLGAYGDAGALVTDNEEWSARARMFANHGRSAKYNHQFEGVNSRLDGIQGAVLGVKLKHLEGWTEKRRENAYLYSRCLEDLDVVTPVEIDDVRSVYHLYVIRVPADSRDELQQFLKARGISTGVHYPIALPYLQAYEYLEHAEQDFPEAFRASQEILSLPMFPELTLEQIEYVAEGIRQFGASSK